VCSIGEVQDQFGQRVGGAKLFNLAIRIAVKLILLEREELVIKRKQHCFQKPYSGEPDARVFITD